MGSLTITKPLPASQLQGTGTNPAFVVTPDPREAWQLPAQSAAHTLDIDLGSVLSVDSFFIGYHSAQAAGQTWAVQILSQYGGGSINGVPVDVTPLLRPEALGPYFHASAKLAAPMTGRYFRFVVTNPTGNPTLTIGNIVLGLAFQPQYGVEYGAGRPIVDLGTAERLKNGGFGIDPGAIVGGYQWQFGDIQPSELAKLYRLLRDRGNTKTVVVIEDPDQTAGINERTHWGLLTKIDVYERLDPLNTRYALQMEDWL